MSNIHNKLVSLARLEAQITDLVMQADALKRDIKDEWQLAAVPDRHPALTERTVVSFEKTPVLKRVLALGLPYTKVDLDRAAFNKAILAGDIDDERLLNEVEVMFDTVFAPRWVEKL